MKYPDKIAELISGLETYGPPVGRVARFIGEDEATVRYWLNEILMKKGYKFLAVPNLTAIGLTRVAVLARVSPTYVPAARKVFDEMSESAYLVHWSSSVLDDIYSIVFSFPTDSLWQLTSFVERLKKTGFLDSVVEVLPFDWVRVLPMKTKYYDFRSGRWEMNLQAEVERSEVRIRPTKRQDFDLVDLLVLQRLQMDGLTSSREIARHLNLNYKKVLRHLEHVKERALSSGCSIRWARTLYNPETGKARSATHNFLYISLFVKNIKRAEMEKLMLEIHRLPFVSAEWGGEHYFCDVMAPLELSNEVLLYLKEVTAPFGDRKRLSISAGETLSYSIVPRLFDETSQSWVFDPDRCLKKIANILPTVERVED